MLLHPTVIVVNAVIGKCISETATVANSRAQFPIFVQSNFLCPDAIRENRKRIIKKYF